VSRRRSLTVAGIAAVIAVALGIWISFEIHWFPVQASTQAHTTSW
jgi:ABC-type spermidine/putrescine transport system permease subunit II